MARTLASMRARPFEAVVLLLMPCYGVAMLVFDARPTAVEQVMPTLIQRGWEVGLLVAGLTGILGVLWPGECATRLGIELAALLVLAAATGMFVVALGATSSREVIPAMAFVGSISLGALWRSVEIVLTLRRMSVNDRTADGPAPLGRAP